MAKSNIEWTEYSWNPVTGCSKVSAGCKNCYAETIANRFWKDREFADVRIDESKLELPLKLKKPRMIFVNSMSDLFHERVPFEIIENCWDVMFNTSFVNPHTYQILTKRPKRMLEFSQWMGAKWRRIDYGNVWLGVSVENQATADERIPLLLQTPAAVRWISVEPMLDHIFLPSSWVDKARYFELGTLDWVVIGCESGQNKRPCKIEWVENLVDQLKHPKVPVFIKQLQINGKVVKDINQFPKNLQIREYPYKK